MITLDEYLTNRTGVDLIPLEDGRTIVSKDMTSQTSERGGDIFAVVSTDTIDSYGDIIHQGPNENGKGWELTRFNGAPVMLWGHNFYSQINISAPETRARVEKDIKTPKGSFAEALVLHPARFDQGDEEAVKIEGKVRRGVIKENSVGFVSLIDEFRRDEENPELILGLEFYEQELLELSWVNRGANPDTTTLFKSMLTRRPDLAALIDTKENAEAAAAKADQEDAYRQLMDRIRTIEQVMSDLGKRFYELERIREAENARVQEAIQQRSKRIDELLSKLGKYAGRS